MFEKVKKFLIIVRDYLIAFVRWLGLGLLIGGLCGVVGALFSKSIAYVTALRGEYPWLVFTLPVLGVISVTIYKLFGVSGIGTNDVFESVRSKERIKFRLAPAVFAASVLTHLGGGSAGREGAALQLGGSISSLVSRVFRLGENTRHILTMCGMGALFSSVFGTPIGACIFAVEVVSVGSLCSAALFPGIVASVTAYLISHAMGTAAERFTLNDVPELSVDIIWRVAVIAIVCALISSVFCKTLHFTEHIFKKYFKNEYLRILVGSALIILATLAVGNQNYNGGGIHIAAEIFEYGTVDYEAFALKIVFTALTVAAGLKGGEIVPTFFIGATLGATVASLVGVSPALGAAVGMAALFCGVTNCPLATILLCGEMFDGKAMVLLALSSIISFLVSAKTSLYSSQKFVYSKLNEEVLTKPTD